MFVENVNASAWTCIQVKLPYRSFHYILRLCVFHLRLKLKRIKCILTEASLEMKLKLNDVVHTQKLSKKRKEPKCLLKTSQETQVQNKLA